jgi:electron transfer flavoprotein alpha subunit
MSNDIWALADFENGKLNSISLQLSSKATELAESLGEKSATIVLGKGSNSTVDLLGTTGVQTILVGDDGIYDEYLTQPAVDAIAALITTEQPKALLIPATSAGRDIAARIAARLDLGLEYNVIAATVQDNEITMLVPAFGGQLNVTSTFVGDGTRIVIARQNAFPIRKVSTTATVRNIPTPAVPSQGAKVSGPFGIETELDDGHMGTEDGYPQYVPPISRSNVEEATIIVSGGRGVGGPEGFVEIDQLAKALNGAVGSSRPVTDDGWIPHRHHIGQTGRTVKPEVYIACGISGAVQHQAGMQTSKHIIAINKDKDAPIFTFCDLGIVGDLKIVIPELTRLIEARKHG